jgi:Zn-dependent M28 family amino/carboxypeptidase
MDAGTDSSLADRLRGHVGYLAGELGERSVRRPAVLAAAASYIEEQWAAMYLEPVSQRYRTHGVECRNIEVTIPGSERPDEILLAGAHYDTVKGSPGADDNASGIAGVLELGRLLRDAEPARTIRLVAFVNEEPPFFFFREMGSMVYAKAAKGRGDDIRMMLSLEMIGWYSDTPGSQRYPPLFHWFYPDRGNFIGFVSNLRSRRALRQAVAAFREASDFPVESLASPAFVPGVAWSDQLSFWREGYPALMVTDTAFHRNPYYHTARDTPDTLDYPRMARVVDGLAGMLRLLAG